MSNSCLVFMYYDQLNVFLADQLVKYFASYLSLSQPGTTFCWDIHKNNE